MATARIELPPKLVPVFAGEADVRGAYGGRGSGKTRTFAKMTAIRAYMWDRAGREGIILCGRQFMNSLDDSSMEEVKAAIRSEPWLHEHFDIGEKYIRTHSKRVSYKFAGLDRSLDSIKSKSRILLCWVDEAEPVTEEAWVKLIPTLREEDSELWVTWNPESKRSPTHKRFRQGRPDPRVKIVEINWRDNPWFPSVLERTRQRDLTDRPERYDHIWEGDFAQVFEGAYYVKEMLAAREQGRLAAVSVVPEVPVHTAWDLGIGDSTAIWFFQMVGNEIRVVDFYENSGVGLPHYAEVLTAKGYLYGDDWVPHDAKVRELGTGRTRVETLISLGRKPRLVPAHNLMDGINAVRETLPHCWFDEKRTDYGLDALRQYRSEFNEDTAVFSDKPLHDWTSHACLTPGHLVRTDRGMVPIENVKVGDLAWTPAGLRRVLHAGPVRMTRLLIDIETDGGGKLTCTPEHKVLTNKGFVEARHLKSCHKVMTGREWTVRLVSWLSMATSIPFRALITGETYGGVTDRQICIGRFSSSPMAKFLAAITSTMSMGIRSTTCFQTSSASPPQTTLENIRWSGSLMAPCSPLTIWPEPRRGRGMRLMRGSRGTPRTGRFLGLVACGIRKIARNAAANIARLILRAPSSATSIAKWQPLEGAVGGQLVFDLTVEGSQCYQANGLLVSNSDAFRYLAMAWREVVAKPPAPPPLPKEIAITGIEHGCVTSNIDPNDERKLNPKEFIEMIKRSRKRRV